MWTIDTATSTLLLHFRRQHFVSFMDHCQYKYLLNWPGHSYSARLKALLQCGAAVIYPSNGWCDDCCSIYADFMHLMMFARAELSVSKCDSSFASYTAQCAIVHPLSGWFAIASKGMLIACAFWRS